MEYEMMSEQQEMDLALYRLWKTLQDASIDLRLILSDNAQTLINKLLEELEE